MMSHAERFRWQHNILAHAKLTATQKNVLTRLSLHLNLKTGLCNPSVETLAKGSGAAERTVQMALSIAEALGVIQRTRGGGRTITTSYVLLLPPAETVHGDAPLTETVHGDALFEVETVHGNVRKGAGDGQKPCTAVHPNIEENKKKNIEAEIEAEFDEWYRLYPRREAKRAALKAYRQALSRGASVEELKLGAMRYAAARQSEPTKFTKQPTTWLNGDCWKDEPLASHGGQHVADEVRAYTGVGPRAAASGSLAAGMASALRQRPDSRLYETNNPGRAGLESRAAGGGCRSR